MISRRSGTAPSHQRSAFEPGRARSGRLQELLADAKISLDDGDEQSFTLRTLRLERYAVTYISAAGGSVTWRPSPGVGTNRFMFVFVARGNLSVTADASRLAASEEAIFVAFPGRTPIVLSSPGPVEGLSLTFDANDVAPATLTAETVGVLHPSSAIFRATYSMLQTLVSTDAPGEGSESTDALRILLRGAAQGLLLAARDIGHSLWDRACALIAEQHQNPGLDVSRIAAQLGVSKSALYRAFEGKPVGIAAQIRVQRSETASRELERNPVIPRATLAALSGFGSVSALQRALRERT